MQGILLNAGAQFRGPISYSADGYEETFATNCLGHFLLLNLLLDRVVAGGRIVFTASGTHDPDTMDGKLVGVAAAPDADALAHDGQDGRKPLSGGQRYATSKLCVIMYAYELDRRLKHAGVPIASIAFDPGLVSETGLDRTAPALVQRLLRTAFVQWAMKRMGVTMGSLDFSGEGLARMIVDPQFASGSGKYFQSRDGQLIETRSSGASYDRSKAGTLWDQSEQLVQLSPQERPVKLQRAAQGQAQGSVQTAPT
ncbi:oxidoreductase [Deinococcus marmoris]|uniref:Oxidoreductase n=1 Tax=Deinococcus marmoris TaxID=249408 RepID=A0A1U7NR10_9DEIO|nr:oxidoreductase [Deinococcus marmoris]